MNPILNRHGKLLETIKQDFKIDFYGDHGIYHWLRVYKNTQILANHYDIISDVFELFALLHDSKRENEYEDKEHGKRAAIFAKELLECKIITLDVQNIQRLLFACANHTKADKKHPLYQDLVIQICFDSDKLDLMRVGIEPDEKRMQTSFAKQLVRDKNYYMGE